jgi:2,3-bisphosphoglycerate-independent phosphoglycerate mutase
MPEEQRKAFNDMRTVMVAEAKERQITAVNAADKILKIRQILCGVVKDPKTGEPQTAHTNFTVELFVVGEAFRGATLREGGRLADVAPTMLAMMGLPTPAEMSGESLIAR